MVVAQSMGGFSAVMACDRIPVGRLILVNAMVPVPGGLPGTGGRPPVRSTLGSLPLRLADTTPISTLKPIFSTTSPPKRLLRYWPTRGMKSTLHSVNVATSRGGPTSPLRRSSVGTTASFR